jgi:regulator of cell morphogenesis and NO signaling
MTVPKSAADRPVGSMDATRPVRDFVLDRPEAARFFESLGIDYCCDGARPLADACKAANRSVESVLAELNTCPPADSQKDWRHHSLTELANHIVEKHHTFTRTEIDRLTALISKVAGKHGQNHPELATVQTTFAALVGELREHMHKEENLLFPYVAELEEAARMQKRAPEPVFGSVQNPVAVMIMEHEASGQALEKIRAVTGNYSVPSDGCASYRALYEALPAFTADLHQHIHLENNILFPRAIELENDPRAITR